MSRITMDFETFSEADIKKVGNWKYSEHPSTIVLCLYWAVNHEATQCWIEGDPLPVKLFKAMQEVDEIEAHNMSFEYSIWVNVCVPKMSWKPLPFAKLRCSAALARYHGLPGSLAGAASALGNTEQ